MPDKQQAVKFLVRLILGLTFIGASVHKIQDPEAFAQIIYGYYIFPEYVINISAIIVPFLELFAGIALIIGVFPRGGLLIINGLLVLFIVIIGFNIARGHQFDCGCFSIGQSGNVSSAAWLLVRDVAMLSGGFFLWSRGSDRLYGSDSFKYRRM